MLQTILYLVLLPLFPKSAQDSDNSSYYFLFEKVDNWAEVYIGESLVYSSGLIGDNPELELRFDFKKDTIESNFIKVKLKNGVSMDGNDYDRHWEIRYELFKGDEPIDYQWEVGDDYRTGVVFEKTYKLDEI